MMHHCRYLDRSIYIFCYITAFCGFNVWHEAIPSHALCLKARRSSGQRLMGELISSGFYNRSWLPTLSGSLANEEIRLHV